MGGLRMGLGAMPLSLKGRPERPAALRVVRRAVELGVTFIDTADAYALDEADTGHNEVLVAEALRGMGAGFGGRDGSPRVRVATKGGMIRPGGRWERDGRPEALRAACEASLRRLDVERIDLYQFHAPDPEVPFLESVGALSRLLGEGKVAAVGLSNVTVAQARAARELVPVVSVQNRLAPWELGETDIPIVTWCRREGLTFLPYAPLGGSGKVEGVLADPALQAVAAQVGCAPAEVILATLLHLSPTVLPIPGASRVESLESSVRATGVALSAAELADARRACRSLPGAPSLPRRLAGRASRWLRRGGGG
ncbi:MAG: aldo/keto reductase [Gemmatimonadales bacterium]|nr:MAG: aldo/keto reductase [Gemmatimonadales bacterium]